MYDKMSDKDEAFVEYFTRFVNGQMSSPKKIGEALSNQHRYLQSMMMKVCLSFIAHLADNYDKNLYDARNKTACEQAYFMIDDLLCRKLIVLQNYIDRETL